MTKAAESALCRKCGEHPRHKPSSLCWRCYNLMLTAKARKGHRTKAKMREAREKSGHATESHS
jgi:hypothetical protein